MINQALLCHLNLCYQEDLFTVALHWLGFHLAVFMSLCLYHFEVLHQKRVMERPKLKQKKIVSNLNLNKVFMLT